MMSEAIHGGKKRTIVMWLGNDGKCGDRADKYDRGHAVGVEELKRKPLHGISAIRFVRKE